MRKNNNIYINCNNCLFFDSNNSLCSLDKCIDYIKIENRNNKHKSKKHIFIDNHKNKSKNISRSVKSFLYLLPVDTFYKAGYKYKNIKQSAKCLGTTESLLKWFLYCVDYNKYKNESDREARIIRVCAFFDGRNEAKKEAIRNSL